MLTVRSTINISSQTVPPIIPVVQGDTGRAILFALADFTIPAGASATYYVQKPSGEAVYNNATIDGNNVLVNLTAQSIIEKGDNYGQVRIAVGEDVVTSFDFILLVKEFRGIEAVQSLTEMNIFDKAVEQAAEAIDEVKTDALDDIGDAKDAALQEIDQSTGNFADDFSASITYAAGDYVMHSGQLYRFTANHAAGAWTGSDAEAVTVGEELTDLKAESTSLKDDLKSAIPSGLVYGSRMAVSGNLFPFAEDTVDGKYYSVSGGALVTQTNINYYGFILAVNPNTEYHCTFARFLCLLDENKVPIADMQTSTTVINTANAKYVAISFDKTLYSVETYCISIGSTLDNTPYKIELPWLFNDTTIKKILPNGISVSANNPAANTTLIALDYSNNVKYNKSYVYMARFSGSIGDITLYHGSGTYGTYLRITQNSILVSSSGTAVYNEPHGLTIADYLYVFVDTDDNDGAVVRVMSNGKLATATVTGWQGWQGQVFALTSSALTYHRLDVIFKDCDLPIWVFGDSYLSKTSNERWGYYLKQWGIDKYMAVGYPGAGSANVYQTLPNMLQITQPKYLVWALGMNDPDNGEVNSAWLTAANNVVALCKQYNIVPIFSKIPNANGSGTLYDHSYKNAWIEASGYRYVDVPSAVGADSSGNWFTDLIATDGIHPSWRGAEAIAYQFLADVSELMEQ